MDSMLKSPGSFNGLTNQNRNLQLRIPAVALAELANSDPRIVAMSADLKVSTQLSEFEKRHPDRFFQFGISERNMIAAAAGMASCGLRPYAGTFAAFSGLLAYENIRTDLGYANQPVRIWATHAGLACGYFATSHHATEDISALRSVANLMILSPCDGESAAALIRATQEVPGPIYLRLGRGREEPVYPDGAPSGYGPGKPHVIRQGSGDLLIAATGILVQEALAAAEFLDEKGISSTVLDVHTLKPFPEDSLAEQAILHRAVLSVEEHNVLGGLGSMVQEAVSQQGIRVPVYMHGIYDEYSIIGAPTHLYEYYGLDGRGLAEVAQRVLKLTDDDRFFSRERHDRILWTESDRREAAAAIRTRSLRASESPAPSEAASGA
jgi:transketolase